jgi:hypothetical protein
MDHHGPNVDGGIAEADLTSDHVYHHGPARYRGPKPARGADRIIDRNVDRNAGIMDRTGGGRRDGTGVHHIAIPV